MKKLMKPYGKELILDLHECNPEYFTRHKIGKFLKQLCIDIDMKRATLHWWDDMGVPEEKKLTEPHLKGTSAIQFITTSNITIHVLDILKKVFINVFSCKDFDHKLVIKKAESFFGGYVVQNKVIKRL